MTQKIIQTGNSLAVTLPKSFVRMVGIKKGNLVKIEKRPNKAQLILSFEGAMQQSLIKQ